MKAVLGLEDGTTFISSGFGVEGTTTGELVVTLISNGYIEAISDPGVAGQILMFGYPLIGNYGANIEQLQSNRVHAAGIIVHELCEFPKQRPTLGQYFEENELIGIEGIDTRMLTIKLREHGVMRAALITGSDDGQEAVRIAQNAPVQETRELIPDVTCENAYHIHGPGKKIAVLDLGCKKSIIQSLGKRGADLYVYPYGTTADVILAENPQALFITNGPGYPFSAPNAIETVKNMLGIIPVHGVCMGSEIIAVALGGKIEKLRLGHRGANHPVRFSDGSVSITYQSHGYTVASDSLPEGCEISCINVNDKTIEGFINNDLGIYCVQFHPEHDAIYDGAEKPIYDIMYRGIPDA
ncbi:MAG TPA: glutamine-hydrolyzing carbamoyl-phosphate synthase small subunit [Methanocorpusculum sp.]|nr:glutamine-hydrolyzing carbamoyl-phosphate synthase small subunit [Methanocorpusculum sp.]HJJ92640.1 glutamine-hydrolyzing carbamoyl-phosphate synthase small subunit [Methanocorpusculum sp.]